MSRKQSSADIMKMKKLSVFEPWSAESLLVITELALPGIGNRCRKTRRRPFSRLFLEIISEKSS